MTWKRDGRTSFHWLSSARGTRPPQAKTKALRQAPKRTSTTLDRARQLASQPGRTEDALQTYRDAVAQSSFDRTIFLEYARFLIARSEGRAAESVLALLLAADGADVDALELYLELVRELDLPVARADWALRRLATDIGNAPDQHRAALDYAISHRLTQILALISLSPDPVNRAIVMIDAEYDDQSLSAEELRAAGIEIGRNDFMRAQLTVALGRGDHDTATLLLKQADPHAVPMNSLRRAIRRARGQGRNDHAIQHLTAFTRLRPEDKWATSLLTDLRQNAFSDYQLAHSGFPFPELRPSPVYEPDRTRVFYVVHNSLPFHSAGYATRTHGLLSSLNRTNWNVDGITRLGYPYDLPSHSGIPDVPAREAIGEVTYRRLLRGRETVKKNPIFFYTERYAEALTELAVEHRPAVIHAASNYLNGLTAVKTARRLGLPSIYEVRGLWEVTRASRDPAWSQGHMFSLMAQMEADAAKGATRVLTITQALRDEMMRRGVDGDKIRIVPNGVDTARFRPAGRDEELASRLGLADRTVIGYVGSVVDYEGIGLLLKAAQSLNCVREDFHVLIVGDGTELERLQHWVHHTKLQHVVTFTGRIPHGEVERYYSLIDIAPFPRLALPVCEMVSPLKPFEAMAMSKAVVASDVAALKEIVTPGVNGYLHEKDSVDSLAEQLARLLDDTTHLRQVGQQARNWVELNRDWRLIAKQVAETYSELTT